MTKISAQVVADSLNPFGDRITSMLLTFPRYILAEFNTHRMFSRNSASSRAIPFKKMVEAVNQDPFIPYAWMKDHSGMQGKVYLDESDSWHCKETWLVARDKAVFQAKILSERYNLTKQMCNRLLEPYMWHTVLVTATEWENFFAQRANEGADIHMQELAYRMLESLNTSQPKKKQVGEWHIPFEDKIDTAVLGMVVPQVETHQPAWPYNYMIKVATAMAARTSYTLVGQEKKSDYAEDIELHDKLWGYPHPSPFEHCAQVPTKDEREWNRHLHTHLDKPYNKQGWEEEGWFGNFRGWKQYRKMLAGENQSDHRVVKWEDGI